MQAEIAFQAGIFGLEFWPVFQAEIFGSFFPGQNSRPKFWPGDRNSGLARNFGSQMNRPIQIKHTFHNYFLDDSKSSNWKRIQVVTRPVNHPRSWPGVVRVPVMRVQVVVALDSPGSTSDVSPSCPSLRSRGGRLCGTYSRAKLPFS